MQRKIVRLVVILALVLLIAPRAAHAQPATQVYRIGLVMPSTASAMASETEAFTQRLQELGYTEGQNLVIEARLGVGRGMCAWAWQGYHGAHPWLDRRC